MKKLRDKLMTIEDVVDQIHDGDTILFGGFGMVRKPMAFVRAIAASKLKDLTLVAVAGGVDLDMLIGTGQATQIWASYVGLDQAGLAPHFRRARETGNVQFFEGSEYTILAGLEAAAKRLPFMPTRSGLGSDLLRVNPRYQVIASPFDDELVVAVPPIAADVALIHVNYADASGYGQIVGDTFADELCSRVARKVFLSAEKIVPPAEVYNTPHLTEIFRILVDGVVEIPFGAHPTSCYPEYTIDLDHMEEYTQAARSAATFAGYRQQYAHLSPSCYTEKVLATRAAAILPAKYQVRGWTHGAQ